jgi:hypothetical protein
MKQLLLACYSEARHVMRELRHDLQEYVDFTELQGLRELCASSLQGETSNSFP